MTAPDPYAALLERLSAEERPLVLERLYRWATNRGLNGHTLNRLVQQGIDKGHLDASGKGDSRLLKLTGAGRVMVQAAAAPAPVAAPPPAPARRSPMPSAYLGDDDEEGDGDGDEESEEAPEDWQTELLGYLGPRDRSADELGAWADGQFLQRGQLWRAVQALVREGKILRKGTGSRATYRRPGPPPEKPAPVRPAPAPTAMAAPAPETTPAPEEPPPATPTAAPETSTAEPAPEAPPEAREPPAAAEETSPASDPPPPPDEPEPTPAPVPPEESPMPKPLDDAALDDLIVALCPTWTRSSILVATFGQHGIGRLPAGRHLRRMQDEGRIQRTAPGPG